MSDENFQSIVQALNELKVELKAELKSELKSETMAINSKLLALDEKWNEKFFQLSRDTLNFARNVIVTAAVVAVLAPLLRESLTFALDLLKQAR
jgi:MerR family transcriptional regulator, repressor of the yfmOP operon